MREEPSRMAHQIPLAKLKSQISPSIIPLLQDQESKEISQSSKTVVEQSSTSPKRHENGESRGQETAISVGQNSTVGDANVDTDQTPPSPPEDSGRERLKKHRVEVAGHVWIPDIWGQEELLQDWIDCSAFDASLFPSGFMSARSALVEEGRRQNSGRLRIENRC